MNPAPPQESVRPAKPAAPVAKPESAARRRGPNYASHEETMKIAERIMDERKELFRRLADA